MCNSCVDSTATAVGGSYYGDGSGRFLLDEVKCAGNETSLDHCNHNGWTVHDCNYWEAAGVQCSMLSSKYLMNLVLNVHYICYKIMLYMAK